MKQAVIYIRVSTDKQARSGLSLDGQLKSCLEYAERNGYSVPDNNIFREEGESAKTANRTKLIELIRFCQKNKGSISTLIVWKVDRFARNAEDHLVVKATLKKLGVTLVSVTEPIEDSVTGRLMETILAGFAQFDNEVRAGRSTGGMIARLEEGAFPFQAPIGYKNIRDLHGRPTLGLDEKSSLVSKWLKEYLKGVHSQKEMYELAPKMGVTSRAGKKLSYQMICNMLRNPVYAGFVTSKMIDGRLVTGIHKDNALISISDYLAIQELLNGKRRLGSKNKKGIDWYLRGGFTRCSLCNSAITSSCPRGNGGVYEKYSCPTCRRSQTGKQVSENREKVHEEFQELLTKIKFTENKLTVFRELILKRWNDESKAFRETRKKLDTEIDKLKDRRQAVIDLLIDRQIDATEKNLQTNKIDTKILELQAQRNIAYDEEIDKENIVEYAVSFISNLSKLWEDAVLEHKLRFQNMIFPEGIWYDFGIGFRTAKIGMPFEVIRNLNEKQSSLVGLVGFEPTTNRL